MTARYVVEIEDHGLVVERIPCHDFAECLMKALEITPKLGKRQIATPVNLDGIDKGNPWGLTKEERDMWWEVAP